MKGRGRRVRGWFIDGAPPGRDKFSRPVATSIPARSLPSLGYSPASHNLPSGRSPNLDDFASSATNGPCKPFWDHTDGHGLGQQVRLLPRTQDKLLFPSELPSPASSDLQPELSKATGTFCSAKPQHMGPPPATTSLPASRCPWLGRLRKSHLQGGTEQLEVMEVRLPWAGREEREKKMKKSSFWGN